MIEILNGIVETVSYEGMNGVRVYHNDVNENYPIHWHNAMEIIMPIRNCYYIEIGGIKFTINEGDILLIPPGELHALYAPPVGERLIIMMDYALMCNLKGMDSALRNFHPYKLIEGNVETELAKKLTVILSDIEKEYFSRFPYREARIYSQLINCFVHIGRESQRNERQFGNVKSNKQHEYVEKFLRVCNFINEHCTEDVTVEQLADIAGFSRFHFARLFKQFTNVSYYEYLTQKRIEHAEKLLITPDISITEVAMQSGFNSLSTFNRVFKNMKHCTPSEYKGLNSITLYDQA